LIVDLEQRADIAQWYAQQQSEISTLATNVESSIEAAVPPQVEQLTSQIERASDQWEAMASLDYRDILEEATGAAADFGRDYIEQLVTDAMMDQARSIIENALTAILDRYAGDIISRVEQSRARVESIIDDVETTLEAALAPLESQLAALRDELNSIRDAIEVEAQRAIEEIDQEVAAVGEQLDDAIQARLQPLRESLESKQQQLRLMGVGADREQLQNEINQLSDQINGVLSEAPDAVQAEISELLQARDDLMGRLETRIQSEVAAIQSRIEQIERQIEEVRERF